MKFTSFFLFTILYCCSRLGFVESKTGKQGGMYYDSGINLYDKTWYTITVKAGGRLTWSHNKVDDKYNHVQIVYGAAETDFVKGGKNFSDAQWKIVETEEPGYVLLVNRAQPNAVLTWWGKSMSGKYVVLYMDMANHTDYLPGGKFRSDSLWKIVPDEDQTTTFLLYNKRFPGNGIMTWTRKIVGDGKKYIQIYDTGSPDSYKTDPDYIWRFEEVEQEVLA